MAPTNYDTLSEAVNALTKEGFIETFEAGETCFKALNSKKEYQSRELKIVESFRFEGMTDPADQSVLFAILANDGTKGTIIMSYSANHNQNVELIKEISFGKP